MEKLTVWAGLSLRALSRAKWSLIFVASVLGMAVMTSHSHKSVATGAAQDTRVVQAGIIDDIIDIIDEWLDPDDEEDDGGPTPAPPPPPPPSPGGGL